MRIATFNIRYGTADDGPNRWDARRDVLLETIAGLEADVLCLQEVQPFQGDEISQSLPHMTRHGLGRYHGVLVPRPHETLSGEHCNILVNTGAFAVERSGTFWHSDTPDVPGSITWDNSLARITTWAILRAMGDGCRFVVFNTHLHTNNEDSEYSPKAASLIIGRMKEIAGDLPYMLLGDFNATPGTYLHRRFTGNNDDCAGLSDTWVALGEDEKEYGTAHEFTGTATSHIDWILTTSDIKPRSITTVRHDRGVPYPSDHFPVVAELRLPPGP